MGVQNRKRKQTGFGGWCREVVLRVHRDERGSFGILVLLTIWALVLLAAMVWNTQELAARRRHAQNAADAAAQSMAVWMARVTNQEAATNMVICQNASAEILLRSVQPTADSIAQRLTGEENMLRRRLWGANPGTGEPNVPDLEYFEEVIGTGEWAGNPLGVELLKLIEKINTDAQTAFNSMQPLLSQQQIANIQQRTLTPIADNVRRLKFIQNVWIDGQTDTTGFGDPPMSNGVKGLHNILGPWLANTRGRYQTTLDAIQSQWGIWQQFVDQTAPAMGTGPATLVQIRSDIHQYQMDFAEKIVDAAKEQRQKIAEFYKVNITIADPQNGSAASSDAAADTGGGGGGGQSSVNDDGSPRGSDQPTSGGALVHAPVDEANVVEAMDHTDSIRVRYPDATFNRFGTTDPRISIDGINVHMDFAALWHPGAGTSRKLESGGTHNYGVGGGQWGAIACAPLARYVNDRLARDEQQLADLLAQIDVIRQNVRSQVYPPQAAPPVPQLNLTVQDTQSTPPRQFSLNPQALAPLPTIAGLPPETAALITRVNQLIRQFDQTAQRYVQTISTLNSTLPALSNQLNQELDRATQNFAEQTWRDIVEGNRVRVLRQMGYDKNFMVLKPYKLRYIPEWAKGGVQQSAYQLVYNDVYNRSIQPVTEAVRRDAYDDYVKGGMDPGQAQGKANGVASRQGPQITGQLAGIVATEVAAEWIYRPWPYEITPPEQAGQENSWGWENVDRRAAFTQLAGAVTIESTKPKFSLTKSLGDGPKTLAMYAQAEAFNWMEYNALYGAGDRYDRITDFGHNVYSGAPSPWRLSTVGGWSWKSRLALADLLPYAQELNPDFRQQFIDGGVPEMDEEALRALIMH